MKPTDGMRTHLDPERYAYPNGAQARRGRAICPDGVVRVVWAGIPDTFFSIPAHCRIKHTYTRGFLYIDDAETSPDYGELKFQPERQP